MFGGSKRRPTKDGGTEPLLHGEAPSDPVNQAANAIFGGVNQVLGGLGGAANSLAQGVQQVGRGEALSIPSKRAQPPRNADSNGLLLVGVTSATNLVVCLCEP